MIQPATKIWAYLHDELTPDERQQFLMAVNSDSELRRELANCAATHASLKEFLPGVDAPCDERAEDLLKQWEAQHPEFDEDTKTRPTLRHLRLILPLTAAAAAALLAWANPIAPIRWQTPNVGNAPQVRGTASQTAHYTQTQLKQAALELQTAVEQTIQSENRWSLQVSLQELHDGAVAVEISGKPRNGWNPLSRSNEDQAMRWQDTFNEVHQFQQAIPELAARIAKDLLP